VLEYWTVGSGGRQGPEGLNPSLQHSDPYSHNPIHRGSPTGQESNTCRLPHEQLETPSINRNLRRRFDTHCIAGLNWPHET